MGGSRTALPGDPPPPTHPPCGEVLPTVGGDSGSKSCVFGVGEAVLEGPEATRGQFGLIWGFFQANTLSTLYPDSWSPRRGLVPGPLDLARENRDPGSRHVAKLTDWGQDDSDGELGTDRGGGRKGQRGWFVKGSPRLDSGCGAVTPFYYTRTGGACIRCGRVMAFRQFGHARVMEHSTMRGHF